MKKRERMKGEEGKSRKKKFLFIFLPALILILVLLFIVYMNYGFEESYSECRADSDCVKVQTTCCPCSSGGEESCIPESEALNHLPKDCPPAEELNCIALYNCRIKSCACIKGNCEAIPLEQ